MLQLAMAERRGSDHQTAVGDRLGRCPIVFGVLQNFRGAHRRPCPETIYLVDTNDYMIAALEDALRNAQANL